MESRTVGQVSKLTNISVQMLHYYERIGLINPGRNNDNSYRVYDDNTIKRLRQIVILRKLRIPLKQIEEILKSGEAEIAIDIFERNLSEINMEIAALSTIRDVIMELINRLGIGESLLLDNERLVEIVDSFAISSNKSLEGEKTMDELNQANKVLDKLSYKDVRIVTLPPATVASLHFVGNDQDGRIPEDQGESEIAALLEQLAQVKPDCRHYGFNHIVDGKHGYERWVTIPEDMEVPPPFVKKQFPGGMYGAYTLRTWDVEWDLLVDWANNHEKYEFNAGSPNMMAGLLEEHLNVLGQYVLPDVKHEMQVDLLIPIKKKTSEWPHELGYILDSETKCGVKTTLIEKKGFTVYGHNYDVPQDVPPLVFYKQLAEDGRLERLKSALKPDVPILVFHYYGGGYCVAVGADLQDAADKEYLKSKAMDVKKAIKKKRWLQFELTMEQGSDLKNCNPHELAPKLGYTFDYSAGFFGVHLCRELEVTEENKNMPFYIWFPVRPL